MAQGVRLSAAVMFVRDVDRSVSFYRDVLALEVIDRNPTAALLGNTDGAQLILRAMGGTASHTLGTLGVQYIVWAAANHEDLDQRERLLRGRSAFRKTTSTVFSLVLLLNKWRRCRPPTRSNPAWGRS